MKYHTLQDKSNLPFYIYFLFSDCGRGPTAALTFCFRKMKAFALLINDIHASRSTLPEFEKNWDEALKVAEEHGAKYIIVGGDMLKDTASQTLDVLTAVWQAYNNACGAGFKLVVAEGNHDKVNRNSMMGYNHIFAPVADVPLDASFRVVHTFNTLDLNPGVRLWVMSYFREDGAFMDIYNRMLKDLDPAYTNILYCHQGIRGGLAQATEDELPTSIFKPFDTVLVGHYHDRKVVDNPDTKIQYIGASRQHNFGEDDQKGYTLLYPDGSTKFIQNQVNERYRTVRISAEEAKTYKEDKADNEKVKVIVTCKESESSAIDKQTLLAAGIDKVELDIQTEVSENVKQEDFSKKFDKQGIVTEYKEYCESHDVDAQLGVEYLTKTM